ncbi:hypothetical protein M885DRAFT_537618 [Pelagophyceae sp. CCMP2097]|nr:hypothetical protein M885DRAFT_537618 [Pelagophyceae sp. CCMP2097]
MLAWVCIMGLSAVCGAPRRRAAAAAWRRVARGGGGGARVPLQEMLRDMAPTAPSFPVQPEEERFRAREVFATGASRDCVLDWNTLRSRVSASDARLLLRTSALDLAVRSHCVVFDFGVFKGWLEKDKAVFIEVKGTLQHAHSIEAAAQGRKDGFSQHHRRPLPQQPDVVERDGDHGAHHDHAPSFALAMMESALDEAYDNARRSFRAVDEAIRAELARLTDLRTAETFRLGTLCRLLPLETQLREEAVRGRRVCALIFDVIDRECGTTADPSQILKEMSVDKVEDVFENYLCRWEYLNDAIEKLTGNIEGTKKLLELALDNERNRIERMELYLSIGGLSFGMVAGVSGIFGMNLVSGLEETPGVFGAVIGATIVVAVGLSYACWQLFHIGQQSQLLEQTNSISCILRRALTPQRSPGFAELGPQNNYAEFAE